MSNTTKLTPAKTADADRWMQEGIKCHTGFKSKFSQLKCLALDAGFYFLSARETACGEHGNWSEFLRGYSHLISERTVRSYVQFAEEAIYFINKVQPDIKGLIKIQIAARDMVMQSPKGYVALCRQLGFMRKFGEYDSVKYAQRKLGHGQQLELDFVKVCSSLDIFTRLGDGVTIDLPEGKDETEALTEIAAKLQSALNRVNAQLNK